MRNNAALMPVNNLRRDVQRNDDKNLPTIFHMLAPGDFLSVSYPRREIEQLANDSQNTGAVFIGFRSPGLPAISIPGLRDAIFANAAKWCSLIIIDMPCLTGYPEADARKILDWERELDTMATALSTIIVAVHDDMTVDPHVTMTQPFIFDGGTGGFLRNDFAIPPRQLLRRLDAADDREWFQIFSGHSRI